MYMVYMVYMVYKPKAIFIIFVHKTNPKATPRSTIHIPNTQQTYLNISPALINKLLAITVLSWIKKAKRQHCKSVSLSSHESGTAFRIK
jgi:hypothetical protein